MFTKIISYTTRRLSECAKMGDSIFTKIIKREIPATILYEDDQCIAINDISPKAPVHFMVVPKKPIKGISVVEPCDKDLLGYMMLKVKEIAEKQKLDEGYRVIINDGLNGGQEVMHMHIHVMGKRQMKWPPG